MAKRKAEVLKKRRDSRKMTKKAIKEDIKGLLLEHDKIAVSRDFYRKHGEFPEQAVTRLFGTWSEVLIYCGVKPSRATAKLHTAIAKHNTMDEFREFFNSEVRPYAGKYERKSKKVGIETAIIGSDFHDVDTDRFSLEVFIDTIKRMNPEYVILNGDIFDNYEFSRFDKDPRRCDVKQRFEFVKENIFGAIREAAPDAQVDLIIGNHEYRLLKLLSGQQPALKDLLGNVMGLSLKDMFGLDDYEVNMVCKLDLATWTKSEENSELKKNFKAYNECYVAAHEKDFGFGLPGTSGHVHKVGITSKVNLVSGSYQWMTTPAMAIADADYIERLESANCGFGIAHMDITNKKVQQYPVLTTEKFCEVGGKFYYRK